MEEGTETVSAGDAAKSAGIRLNEEEQEEVKMGQEEDNSKAEDQGERDQEKGDSGGSDSEGSLWDEDKQNKNMKEAEPMEDKEMTEDKDGAVAAELLSLSQGRMSTRSAEQRKKEAEEEDAEEDEWNQNEISEDDTKVESKKKAVGRITLRKKGQPSQH